MHQILKSTKFEWMEESNSELGELGVIFYTISWKYWMLKLWGSRNKLSVWYLVPGSIWCQEWDVWSTAPLQSHCPAGKWIKTDSFHYFRRGNILINNFTKPVRASLGNWIIYQYIGLELHLWQTQYIKTASYKVLPRLPYSWYGLQGSQLIHLKILIKIVFFGWEISGEVEQFCIEDESEVGTDWVMALNLTFVWKPFSVWEIYGSIYICTPVGRALWLSSPSLLSRPDLN